MSLTEDWYAQKFRQRNCHLSQHYTEKGKQKDEFRTEILEGYDLKVIRFTNRQINTNFRGVCEYIDAAVKASLREGGGTLRGSPKRMK